MSSTSPLQPNQTTITLSQEDLPLFQVFVPYRDKIMELHRAKLFEVESGHFDININNSQIQNVYYQVITFKRESNKAIPI